MESAPSTTENGFEEKTAMIGSTRNDLVFIGQPSKSAVLLATFTVPLVEDAVR